MITGYVTSEIIPADMQARERHSYSLPVTEYSRVERGRSEIHVSA